MKLSEIFTTRGFGFARMFMLHDDTVIVGEVPEAPIVFSSEGETLVHFCRRLHEQFEEFKFTGTHDLVGRRAVAEKNRGTAKHDSNKEGILGKVVAYAVTYEREREWEDSFTLTSRGVVFEIEVQV